MKPSRFEQEKNCNPWPVLIYPEFKSTGHLLHMASQMIGKLKLLTPFEPEWANVSFSLTSSGLTTGLIPLNDRGFSIDIDLISHRIICATTSGQKSSLNLESMCVAELYGLFIDSLNNMGLSVTINPRPQEVEHPIAFMDDTDWCEYKAELANAWWRILVSTSFVMQKYHARFRGKTQPLGFMWGTFDLRDVRYNGKFIKPATEGPMSGYIRRNAMDEETIEIGWWSGNDLYPEPAYYSLTYPQPEKIELAKITPHYAHWNASIGEFILNYDQLRQAKNPELDLLAFFESTYKAGAELGKWDPALIGSGQPI